VTREAGGAALPDTRDKLMVLHAAARERRESAALGSEEFRAAAEEVARIEIAIASVEEPAPEIPADAVDPEGA
jgi:hypothetical protein